MKTTQFKFIRNLMHDRSDADIIEAEERFARYLAIVARIAERTAIESAEKSSNIIGSQEIGGGEPTTNAA